MSEFIQTMLHADTLTGLFHVTAAVICLLLGPYIFLNRKEDRRHKMLGRIWALLMLTVNISALLTYDINGKPNMFHIFAVVNLAALIPALYFVCRYQRTRDRFHLLMHRRLMGWAYFGLAAAGVWQVATTFIRLGHISMPLGLMFNILGILTFLSAGIVFIFLRKTEPKFS